MLTFHLDVEATNDFIRRVLQETKVRMGATPYRVVDVVKIDNVQVKGYYYAPLSNELVGHSEYNATVDVSVEVHTVRAHVITLTFKMQNPMTMDLYNREIASRFNSLEAVKVHEATLSRDYLEALQCMLYLVATGIYMKDSLEYICEVGCYEDYSVIEEGYRIFAQLEGNETSVTDIVGFTCRDEISTQGQAVPLWNVLAYVYLHEFLIYKQDWYTDKVGVAGYAEHAVAFNTLASPQNNASHGSNLISVLLENTTHEPYLFDVKPDFTRQCMYFDVGFFAENGVDIKEWYHFTPVSCLRLIRSDNDVRFEILYDTHLHDYSYIIDSYDSEIPFISEFFKRYRNL